MKKTCIKQTRCNNCNNRKAVKGTIGETSYTGNGTGVTTTVYASYQRLTTYNLTLQCNLENDKFSVTAIGNGDYDNPFIVVTE